MNTPDGGDDEALVARARAALERQDLDPTTLRKLAAARRAALDQVERPGRARARWLPLGAAAVVALVAVGVASSLRGPASAPIAALAVTPDLGTELEVLLDEDDPALYDEELEFYTWLDEAALDEQPDAG